MMPDLLVLLVSLPDDLDIAPLRDARIQTVIGWKVIRLCCPFSIYLTLLRVQASEHLWGGRVVAERVVRDLGPIAFLAGGRKGFWGGHGSFTHDEVIIMFLSHILPLAQCACR